MEIVRYLDAGHGPLVGIQDGAGVHELPVPSLSALLALPLAEIRDVTAKATASAVAGGVTLLPPAEGRMEVWAAGVTYFRSREARLEESGGADFYDHVYDAERPELFFKSVPWRVVTHGQPIAIRRDSALNVPEAELAIVVNSAAEIVGYTICNDVSSRTIEAENPLYLPQAKVYAGACAVAPVIRPAWEISATDLAIRMEITTGRCGGVVGKHQHQPDQAPAAEPRRLAVRRAALPRRRHHLHWHRHRARDHLHTRAW